VEEIGYKTTNIITLGGTYNVFYGLYRMWERNEVRGVEDLCNINA